MSVEKHTINDLKIDRNRPAGPFPWKSIIISGLAVALAVAGYFVWSHRTTPALVRASTVVETTTGGSKSQTVLNASGYVTARRQATVSCKITGQISEVLFEEGQRVDASQVLARIDRSNLEASLDMAKAQLDSAKVQIDETRAQLNQSELDLKRNEALAENKIASQSELDHSRSDTAVLRAHLAYLQAAVKVAEKQIATWERQLDDTIIRAPFAGVVIAKAAQPGEMISPVSAGGAGTRTGICTLVDMSSLEIEVDVNENYLNRVEPGRRAEAVLDAYTDWTIPCKVIAIIPTADRQKSTVKVRVGFDQLDPRILPDMGVKVSFQGGEQSAVTRSVKISTSAVHKDGAQPYVWLLKNSRIERRNIAVGPETFGEVSVLSNLFGGERIVIESSDNLKDGDSVKEKKS